MMNELSYTPTQDEFLAIERRARKMRAEAVANASRRTWSRMTGLFRH